jgi:hypothetical protein
MIQIRRLGIDQSWVTNMADSRPWARNPKINFRRWTSPAARQSHASAASDCDVNLRLFGWFHVDLAEHQRDDSSSRFLRLDGDCFCMPGMVIQLLEKEASHV